MLGYYIDKDFIFENIRVEYNENVRVKQFTDSVFSKSNFINNIELIDEVAIKIKELSKGKKIGLITYRQLKWTDERSFYELLAEKCGADICSYFGNVRGLNEFDNNNIEQLFVVGRHSIGEGVENMYRKLNSEVVSDLAEEQDFKRLDKQEVYKMRDSSGVGITRKHYFDEQCMALDRHFNKGETYQAGHRLRMIHGTEEKELFLMTNEVLDFTVDELLDFKGTKLQNIIKRMEVVIERDGEISSSNKIIGMEIDERQGLVADNKQGINEYFKDRCLKRDEKDKAGRVRGVLYYIK